MRLTEAQARAMATFIDKCWFRFDLIDLCPHLVMDGQSLYFGVWESRLVKERDGAVKLYRDMYFPFGSRS